MKTIARHDGARPRIPEGRSPAALAFSTRFRDYLAMWAPIAGKAVLVVLALVALSLLGKAAMAEERQVATDASSSIPPPSLPAAPEPSALAAVPDASASPPSEEAAPKQASAVLPDGRIVLNLAGENELVKLPGVGPKRAQAILAVRQRLGRFRRVEDLLRVKGIGRKMLERIRPVVVVDPPREEA